jgi:hypothetical protein
MGQVGFFHHFLAVVAPVYSSTFWYPVVHALEVPVHADGH